MSPEEPLVLGGWVESVVGGSVSGNALLDFNPCGKKCHRHFWGRKIVDNMVLLLIIKESRVFLYCPVLEYIICFFHRCHTSAILPKP